MKYLHYRWFSIVLSLSLLIAFLVVLGQNTIRADSFSVKVGDRVRYSVITTGSESGAWVSPMDQAFWVEVEVQQVSNVNVTLSETIYLKDGSESVRTTSSDLFTTQSSGFHYYVVASNLDLGDKVGNYTVWMNDTGTFEDVELTLNGTILRTYGGVTREVNMLKFSELAQSFEWLNNNTREYYWDRETGFLLERVYETRIVELGGAPVSTLKLEIVETSMWEMMAKPFWDQLWPWAIIILGGVMAIGLIIFMKMPKTKDSEISEDEEEK